MISQESSRSIADMSISLVILMEVVLFLFLFFKYRIEALFFVWNSWILAFFSLFSMIVELFWVVYSWRIFLVLTVGSDAGCSPLFLLVRVM